MQLKKRFVKEGSLRALCSFFTLIAMFISVLSASTVNYLGAVGSRAHALALEALSTGSTVIVDAGHGGEDPGAIGVNGAYEKDINLAVALMVGELLTSEGFAVIYTRTDDRMLYGKGENIKGLRKLSDLQNRCKIAAEYQDAIFISIHMNSFSNEKYDGFQAYYSEKNELSRILSSEITASVKGALQPNNRRTDKSGEGMYLLDNVDNPAVLLECGFLTNAAECEKLSEKEYQKRLSLAIVCGIINYRNKLTL